MNDEPKLSKTPISVDSNTTPITQRKIPEVDPSNWSTLPLGELYEHLTVLQNRYFMMAEMKKFDTADQILGYVNLLSNIIKQREHKRPGISTNE